VDGSAIGCPECDATCVARVTPDQMRCNRCGHQWDFATFLNIKTWIESEREEIWEGCATAHSAISSSHNIGKKKRLLTHYYRTWLNRLGILQHKLVINMLLPLANEYQTGNKRLWFQNTYNDVWSSIESEYQNWFVCVVHGSSSFSKNWRVPEWAWSLTGHLKGIPGCKKDPNSVLMFLFGFEHVVRRTLLIGRETAIKDALSAINSSSAQIQTEGTPQHIPAPKADQDSQSYAPTGDNSNRTPQSKETKSILGRWAEERLEEIQKFVRLVRGGTSPDSLRNQFQTLFSDVFDKLQDWKRKEFFERAQGPFMKVPDLMEILGDVKSITSATLSDYRKAYRHENGMGRKRSAARRAQSRPLTLP
jgi:hypothetical protein